MNVQRRVTRSTKIRTNKKNLAELGQCGLKKKRERRCIPTSKYRNGCSKERENI